ncbi:MAG: na+/Pi-cotransporter family protein [Micavibrio sp.]|nr:na+/Pi-cotransporter family protein [Micavibrio sp.]|tara:strand:+ start:203418 stop:205100 length:1683 start_codon:yes stop_codon:yes gene_type:complete
MSPTFIFLQILSSICILLFGLMMVRKGATRAFGASLRDFLAKTAGSKIKGFIAGVIATVILQSSTATTMLISSFVGRGLLGVTGGLAIVLGADVGTTLVAQILTFDLSWLAPICLIIGYVLHTNKSNANTKKQVGRIIFGLGMMLLALAMIKDVALPLGESENFKAVLKPLATDPIFALILAALLTWLFHSSLAMVLMISSFFIVGIVPFHVALVMVLGANIGNVFPAVISARADSVNALRIPVGNLVMRAVGVLAFFPFMVKIADWITVEYGASEWAIVMFHTGFNVVLAIVFLPLTKLIARIVRRIVPYVTEGKDTTKPVYLKESEQGTPFLGLMGASREVLRLAELSVDMLELCQGAFEKNDMQKLLKAREMDNVIDDLFAQVKTYLARMNANILTEKEAKRHFEIMTFAVNIEHIGDVIDRNLLVMVEKKIKQNKKFSKEGYAEIQSLFGMVLDSLELAQKVFISQDVSLARQLVKNKTEIKNAEIRTSRAHISRLSEGVPETLDTSSMHLDMIRDLRRINALVTSVAYPLLEEEGHLNKSRLRPRDKVKKSKTKE